MAAHKSTATRTTRWSTDKEEVERLVYALPDHAQTALLWLLRLWAERKVNPSAELDAAIERIEAALYDGHTDELNPPASLVSH
jgi:hypothetical protein